MSKKFRPGEQAPQSGEYVSYDRDGHNGGTTYLEKGQRFPATQHEGSYYEMEEWDLNNNKKECKICCILFRFNHDFLCFCTIFNIGIRFFEQNKLEIWFILLF